MDSIYSVNIERAVLSSIFFNPEELEDVLGVLKPKDFYLPAHKAIFEEIVKLHSEDMPIDEDFVRNRVDKKDVNDGVLLEILRANPITTTAAYVSEIQDASVRREVARLAASIKKVAIEDEISANEALDTIQGELYKISTNSATSELKDMQTVTSDTLAYIEKMKKLGNKYLIGQTTGFEALDKKTTGFNEGDLVIIAARPAMGKTALVLNMALKNVEQKQLVIFLSLEMPPAQLMLFFFNDTATTEIYTLSLHDALPTISLSIIEISASLLEPPISRTSETFPALIPLLIMYSLFSSCSDTGIFSFFACKNASFTKSASIIGTPSSDTPT